MPQKWKKDLSLIDDGLSQIDQAIEITKKFKLRLIFLREDNHEWILGECYQGIRGWFEYRPKIKRILPIKIIVDERNDFNNPWFQAACLPSQKSNELLKHPFPITCKNLNSILDNLIQGEFQYSVKFRDVFSKPHNWGNN